MRGTVVATVVKLVQTPNSIIVKYLYSDAANLLYVCVVVIERPS
jgi:hypothetical protein